MRTWEMSSLGNFIPPPFCVLYLSFAIYSLILGFLGVLVAIWLLNSPWVGVVLGVCLPLFAWVGRFILGLGSLVHGPPIIAP